MSKDSFEFELNESGVRELLRSAEMMNVCSQCANQVLSRLGDGYSVSTYTGTNRVNAAIKAESNEAYQDCLNNNTLLKAL